MWEYIAHNGAEEFIKQALQAKRRKDGKNDAGLFPNSNYNQQLKWASGIKRESGGHLVQEEIDSLDDEAYQREMSIFKQ